MKREALLEKGFNEEQTTEILNMFHETNQQNDNLQKEVNKYKGFEAKYNALQKQVDDINNAKLTEEEQIAKKNKEADDYLNKSKVIYNTAKAKEILAGYDVTDDLIQNLVNGDEASTIASANNLKTLLDSKIENAKLKAKEEMYNANVKPTPSNVAQPNDIMTKEKFDKLTMSEQKVWKDAHLEEYHQFYPQK